METKYFVNNAHYQKDLDWYQSHWFAGTTRDQLVGEVDPDDMFFGDAVECIASAVNLAQIKFTQSVQKTYCGSGASPRFTPGAAFQQD